MQAEFLFGEDNYFDITHSFQVGAATYHVLGLRKDRPTYSNQYYLFNCHQNSPIRSFLPAIRPSTEKSARTNDSFEHERKTLIKAIGGLKKDGEADRARWEKSFEQIQNLIELLRKDFAGHQPTNNETIKTHLQSFFKTVKELETKLLVEFESNRNDHRLQEQQDLRLKTIEETQKTMFDKLNQIAKKIDEQPANHQTSIKQSTDSITNFIEEQQTNINLQLNQISTRIEQKSSSQQISVEQITNSISSLIKAEQTNLSVQLNQIKDLIDLFGKVNIPATTSSGENSPPPPGSLSIVQVRQLFIEQRSFLQDFLGKQQVNLVEQLSQTINVNLKQILLTHASSSNDLMRQLFVDLRKSITELFLTGPEPHVPLTDQNPFQVSIETAEYAEVYAKLYVDNQECPKDQHTLCQRDPVSKDLLQCFVSPPLTSGTLALKIFAKTEKEDQYRAAITVEMPLVNIKRGWTFPKLERAFYEHRCILIEPLRSFVQLNEQLTIHLVLPQVSTVQIRNGEQIIQLETDQLPQGILKMKLQVRGHITVQGQWNGHRETNICRFSLVE